MHGAKIGIATLAMALVVAFALSGCASLTSEPRLEAPAITRFSVATAGGPLPAGWEPWAFGAFKRPTEYKLVDVDGHTVIRASAQRAASGLIHRVKSSTREFPMLSWRWKVPALIERADNTKQHLEDSPVRVIVAFAGDTATLPVMERIAFKKFKMLTKQELPYATLMYIWENKADRETIVPSHHTSRIKMIVAESGAEGTGQWRDQTRDVHADYKRAFGEEPPPIAWIGIMTDSDNTGESTAGYYGDIRLSAR